MSLVAFAGGVLFGTVGVSILKSKDAKNVYTHATAVALRGKEKAEETLTTLKENCEDIAADARDINEKRAAEAEEMTLAKAKAIIAEYEAKANAPEEAEEEEPAAPKKTTRKTTKKA